VRKITSLLAVVSLLSTTSVTYAAQPFVVRDVQMGITATFPDKPEFSPMSACPDMPNCRYTSWDFSDWGNGDEYCSFNLVVADFSNNKGQVLEPNKAIQWALSQSYDSDDEVLSDVDISKGNTYGREMLVRITIDGFGQVGYQRNYIRVLVRDNRIYSANSRCNERVDSAKQRKFMASVKLL